MYRYKVRFKPELEHRRKADRERCYQYSCRERMLKKPVQGTVVSSDITKEKKKHNDYPFYRTITAIRRYYIVQQLMYSIEKVGWIRRAVSCVAGMFTCIAQMKVYALISPLVGLIDIPLSAIIRGPMTVAPSCQSLSMKEVRNTTLLPITILLEPFTHMGRLKVQRKPVTFDCKADLSLASQQNIIQHSYVRVVVIFNFMVYALLSLLNLATSCLLLCVPRTRHGASIPTTPSASEQHVTYNSSMTFHTPEQVVSIKWSYEMSVKPNHLMDFNLCPPYSLKPPEGTYVKV